MVLAARSLERLEALAEELGGSEHALAVRCDVSDWEQQQRMVKELLEWERELKRWERKWIPTVLLLVTTLVLKRKKLESKRELWREGMRKRKLEWEQQERKLEHERVDNHTDPTN